MEPETAARKAENGFLPTPEIPQDLPPVELTENARQVLVRRYVRRDRHGQPAETVEEMFWRVAYHVASVESQWGEDVVALSKEFYNLLTSKGFFPNSPTFTGAGTPLGQLAACFVLPIVDDMGRDPAGIFQTLRDAALIQQTGGGNGFSFSRLRPQGTLVKSSAGKATGPVGFLRVYDKAFGEVAQGGTRRGANMAVLRVDHPDIEEFVTCKTDENAITNFNISVGITDAFMRAVENDEDWDLRFPDVSAPEYKEIRGTLDQAEAAGVPIKVYKTVRARELFDKIVRQAHHNGEPGVLFLDAANRSNPVPHLYQLEATNPCVTGETLIYTENGLREARKLAEEGFSQQVVIDGRLAKQALLPGSPVFASGIKNVFKLITREGYELRLTADHRVMTPAGWVRAEELKPGSQVFILNRKGGFGSDGSLDEGRIFGRLASEKSSLPARLPGISYRDTQPVVSSSVRTFESMTAVSTLTLKPRLETKPAQSGVPETVFRGSEDMQRGFLQALFTADAEVVSRQSGCTVRLDSPQLRLLKEVQRVLLNFGIASKLHENQQDANNLDGILTGCHTLEISKTNLRTFHDEIGFLSETKQTRLQRYIHGVHRLNRETFLATVKSLVPDGREMVYDLFQQQTHSFTANGIVVHNCGEQWLGPYENCCLGSVNLAQHLGPEGTVDWEKLRRSVVTSTRFLDDVVDANAYVPAVPQLEKAAHNARRIGLGIMGLGDLMYHAGIRYGSLEGQEFAAQVMEFVRYHCMLTSIQRAERLGPFPAIKGSIYDPEDLKWVPPSPVSAYQNDFGRPEIDWGSVVGGIQDHGIRNAAQTTVAPTGTIATVAGCEGYGCEPVFALAYIRHVNDQGTDLQLTYASPLFEKALEDAGIDDEMRQAIFQRVLEHGTCQDVDEIPEHICNVFAVSADITAEEHVRMQAALQAFVDNSMSKTVNFPEDATWEDVKKAYQLAWALGCKGITVYVTGSREKVVLETKATAQKKQKVEAPLEDASEQISLWRDTKKPRPRSLHGYTYSISTPLGKAFITINENGGNQPFEVFINTAKAGSDTAAVSEAIGRLISYILRLASPVLPRERLAHVMSQLQGIGGGRSLGFGPNRVRSLPDGVAHVLIDYLQKDMVLHEDVHGEDETDVDGYMEIEIPHRDQPLEQGFLKIGDLCPECGEAAVVNEEGCRKCYACGFSEC